MSKNTPIQWCDSTVNPSMGCDGCELWSLLRKSCYAGLLHVLRGKSNPGFAPTFEEVTKFPGRMADAARWSDLFGKKRPEKPWLRRLPRLIFVSDMGDSLSKAITFDFLFAEIIVNATSDLGRRHQWLWLTKRPDRMADFSDWLAADGHPWPANLWAGTSITGQVTVSRVSPLLEVGDEKTIRFLSVEPQIEPIDLGHQLRSLDWVIQGGESGPEARPFHLEWARDLAGACRDLGVPYFLKQVGRRPYRDGKPVKFLDSHGGDWSEWPRNLRVRELPPIVHAKR
jgi:protein gp37